MFLKKKNPTFLDSALVRLDFPRDDRVMIFIHVIDNANGRMQNSVDIVKFYSAKLH